MADITLKSGKKLDIDLDRISITEYRSLFEAAPEQEYKILAKVLDMPVEEVSSLGAREWRRVIAAVVRAMQEPLADPN